MVNKTVITLPAADPCDLPAQKAPLPHGGRAGAKRKRQAEEAKAKKKLVSNINEPKKKKKVKEKILDF